MNFEENKENYYQGNNSNLGEIKIPSPASCKTKFLFYFYNLINGDTFLSLF